MSGFPASADARACAAAGRVGDWRVFLPWGIAEEEEVRERLLTSYAIVRSGLPKRVQATLGAVPGV